MFFANCLSTNKNIFKIALTKIKLLCIYCYFVVVNIPKIPLVSECLYISDGQTKVITPEYTLLNIVTAA